MKKRIALASTLVLASLAAVLAVSVIFAGNTYVPPSDIESCYAKEEITYCCKSGYFDVSQTEDGVRFFEPDSPVTRAEFAKILAQFLKINPDKYQRSALTVEDAADIPEKYLPYVRAVLAEGLMGLLGVSGKTYFLPEAYVSREEAAYMIGNLIIAAVSTSKSSAFSDYSDMTEAYRKNADILIAFEIMIGYPDGTLRPGDNISREELALMLFRAKSSGEEIKY